MIINVFIVYLATLIICYYALRKKVFLVYAPLISVLFDTLVYYEDSQFHLLRVVIFFGYIGYYFVFSKKIKTNHYFTLYKVLVWALFFFWIFLSFVNSDVRNDSIRTSITNILPILLSTCVPFGLIKNKNLKTHIIRSALLSLFVFVVFFFLSNIFGLTRNVYDSSTTFTSGFQDAHLYYPPLALFILYVLKSKFKSYQFVIFLIAIIILILSLRRTAIVIFPIAYILYSLMNRKQLKRNVTFLFGAALILLLSFPLYSDYLSKQVESRDDIFNNDYDVTKEFRALETILVLRDFATKNSITENLFGQNLFNSSGNYGDGVLGKRVLHIDYNLLLHGSGIVGLSLYLMVLISLFILIRRSRTITNKRIGLILFFLMIMISFSGQMHIITFRLFLFQTMILLSLYEKNISD